MNLGRTVFSHLTHPRPSAATDLYTLTQACAFFANAVKTHASVVLSVCVRRQFSKQVALDLSIYEILQILSVAVFEKNPILGVFSNLEVSSRSRYPEWN